MGISNLIGKRLKNVKKAAISNHISQRSCPISFDDFKILAKDSNKLKLFPFQ